MDFVHKTAILLILCGLLDSGDAAVVNLTISSRNVLNGTSIKMTAAYDPTLGNRFFKELECGYTNPGGILFTSLTEYSSFNNRIETDPALTAAQSARLNITSTGNPMTLEISPIIIEDEKRTFYCRLNYYDSGGVARITESQKYHLENVYYPQVLDTASSMNSSTSLTEGITATLRCTVTGRPASTVTWRYNSAINATISNTLTTNGHLITVTSVLTIHNPVQSMNGQQITCISNHSFSAPISNVTTLRIDYRPVNTTLTISPQNPKLNQIIKMTCNAIGKPAVSMYKFYVNDTSIGNSTNGSLSVNANDCLKFNGYFKCIPENSKGQGEIKQQLILVTDNVKTSAASETVTYNETTNATLLCSVSGCPTPSVSWRKNGVSLNKYGNSLALASLNRSDAGQYSCHAQNAYTNSSSQIQVTVNYAPDQVHLNASTFEPLTGTSVNLTCVAKASPAANFRFISVNGSNETTVQDSASPTYKTQSLDYNNYNNYKAMYRCIAYNMLGNGTKIITLDIQVLPKILSFAVTPSIVNETQNATAECKVNAANPLPRINITDNSNNAIAQTRGKGRLVHITRNQAGIYTCRADNGVGAAVTATAVLIVNHAPDRVELNAKNVTLLTGSSTTLTCSARASPAANYRFISVNGSNETTVQDSASPTYKTPSLDYNNFNNYKAIYRCIPYNMYGNGPAQNITLDIQVPPMISFSITPSTVNETQNATAECKVNAANPPPTITITDNSNNVIAHTGGQARLVRVTGNHNGTYTCRATNGIGAAVNKTAVFIVNHTPDQVNLTASTLTPITGSSVTLNCSARATPAANRFKFVNIKGSRTTLQDGPSSNVTIAAIYYEHFDNYKAVYECTAYNMMGEGSTKNITLDIQVSPKISVSPAMTVIEGGSAVLECNVTAANPSATVTWRSPTNAVIPHTNGRALLSSIKRNQNGLYTCQASNRIGSATNTSILTVDLKPKGKENVALIAGIAGGCVGLLIIAALCYVFAKRSRHRSSAKESMGCNDIAAYGDSEKSQSSSIEMKCVKVDGLHYKAPDGSVYASINKEKPGDANGAIDNANFATDTDGAYEPIGNDTPQKKQEEGNYADLGIFQSPNANNDKPKEIPKTEYATLEELGPLREFKEPENQAVEDPQTHKITVAPESNKDRALGKDQADKAPDTSASLAFPVVEE